jgi:membrane associated rhomboid family serine protease
MGIYDRDYYRREGPSLLGSFTERGKMCKWLIGINVVAFIIQIITQPRPVDPFLGTLVPSGPGWFTSLFELNTDAVAHGEVWRLLTYAFLHDWLSYWHIVFNMLFLWWFGSDVEDMYGPREFLAIYLVSALAGGVAFQLGWWAGMNHGNCIGASGAVTAIMVLCAIHFPRRLIYLWLFIPIPIWVFVGVQVVQDLFGFLSGSPGRTAVSVHLAGAAFAAVYYYQHWRLLNVWTAVRELAQQRSRPRLRVYREEPPQPVSVAAPPPTGESVDEHLEAKLDAVLEKVARFGQNSLTESERRILMRASEVYKRRRT